MKNAAEIIYTCTTVAAIIAVWVHVGPVSAWAFGAICCAVPYVLPQDPPDDREEGPPDAP
jgi:hypothetical protein